MSCGDPHEVDCQEVVRQVQEYLHRELDEVDIALIHRHLAACAPCLREYDLEEALRALVVRSCTCQAPPQLRQSVMARITTTITTITTTEG